LQCDPHYHRFATPPQPCTNFSFRQVFDAAGAGIIMATASFAGRAGTETHEK
jgi:hypothetical protein